MSAQPCLSTRGKLLSLSCREQRWATWSVTALKYLGQPKSRSSASSFTWLSIPSMSSMEKNRMAQRGETGNWVTASGYARKAKPGPGLWTETLFSFSLIVLRTAKTFICVESRQSSRDRNITETEPPAVTWSCYVRNVFLCHMRHEANNGKDYKASKHAGTRVDAAHNDRVSGERKYKTGGCC